jgi:hypothetical protein
VHQRRKLQSIHFYIKKFLISRLGDEKESCCEIALAARQKMPALKETAALSEPLSCKFYEIAVIVHITQKRSSRPSFARPLF